MPTIAFGFGLVTGSKTVLRVLYCLQCCIGLGEEGFCDPLVQAASVGPIVCLAQRDLWAVRAASSTNIATAGHDMYLFNARHMQLGPA